MRERSGGTAIEPVLARLLVDEIVAIVTSSSLKFVDEIYRKLRVAEGFNERSITH